MTEHYFLYAFGVAGTLTAVPNPTQVSGTVSYQAGFPIGYQTASTAPGYLSIPRDQFNQIMFDTTGAIQQIQQTGLPSWITAAANGGTSYSYALGAQVWYNGVPYISLIANNTSTPPTNWQVIGVTTSLYFNYAADTGSANTYVIAPNPSIGSLAAGQVVNLNPAFGNSGASTLNVNGTGALPIITLGNVAISAGMLSPSGFYFLTYNSALNSWVLQNPTLGSAAYVNTGTGSTQVPLNSQLGTAAYLNVGTSVNNIVQLLSTGLPAVSGQNLTNLPAQFTVSSGKIVLGTLTVQWGQYNPGSPVYNPTVTFSTNFSAVPKVFATAAPISTSGAAVFTTVPYDTVTTSQFVAKTFGGNGGAPQAYPFSWLAIGTT